MPIRPERKALYADNWSELRSRILLRAGGDITDPRIGSHCEVCGVRNYSVGYRDDERAFHELAECDSYREAMQAREATREVLNSIIIVLTISHTDHDETNNSDDNLRALCQQCHNTHDAAYRARNRRRP